MQIRNLMAKLAESGIACSYRGDEDVAFQRLILYPKTVVEGDFIAVVDKSWDPSTRKQFKDRDIKVQIKEALKAGFTGFICGSDVAEHPLLKNANVISADSSLGLSVAIAKVFRDVPERAMLTAVTGSAGKSTTKAMLAHALEAMDESARIFSPPSPQNIFRSVISHLVRLHSYDHAVVEVAASCFKLFARHDLTLAADVAIVTAISEAHMDYLGSLEDIALIKSQIFNGPAPGGTAIINADTPHADVLIRRAVEEGCQLVTYGEDPNATIRLLDYQPSTGEVEVAIGQERLAYTLGAHGKHMAINSLAVVAALRCYRLPNWEKGVQALSTFQALKGRGEVTTFSPASDVTVELIDEAYNANPASMSASLGMLSERNPKEGARRIAVLGDMLELGGDAQEIHNELASPLAEFPPDVIHLFGPQMKGLYEILREQGVDVRHWDSLEPLRKAITIEARDGDLLLVKSSNGTGLNKLVARLQA